MKNVDEIKSRTVKGVAVLTGRGIFLRLLSFISLGFLGSFLKQDEFGVFILVSAVVNFLVYFSDIGLAAALIQKKEKITREDLSTTFTVQQFLVVSSLVILLLLTPRIQGIYNLTPEGVNLLYALGFSFFASSLKTIPSILLERDLEFNRWIIPQLIEDVIYNFTVVFFAWKGFGITSFTYAVVLRSLFGLVSMYIIKPWKPTFHFSSDSLKHLLKFGFPYQVNTFLAVLKDDGMTIVLGGILGTAGVGILGWAQKWAQVPLRLFMDTVTKVSFPAFARLQHDKSELAKSVTKSIFFICFLVFPSIAALLVLAPRIIEIVPRYDKWQGAIIPLTLVSINVAFAASTTQLTNLLNAIGKIKLTFKFMVMWVVLSWLLIPILSIKFGVIGASLAYGLVGLSSVVVIYTAWKLVPFSIIDSIIKPAIGAIIMGIVMYLISINLSPSIFNLILIGTIGTMVYGFSSYFLTGKAIVKDVQKIVSQFLPKR